MEPWRLLPMTFDQTTFVPKWTVRDRSLEAFCKAGTAIAQLWKLVDDWISILWRLGRTLWSWIHLAKVFSTLKFRSSDWTKKFAGPHKPLVLWFGHVLRVAATQCRTFLMWLGSDKLKIRQWKAECASRLANLCSWKKIMVSKYSHLQHWEVQTNPITT